MRPEKGELKLVFCINLPPKLLHGWIGENAPGFTGWHPTYGRESEFELDIDKDADEIARLWAFAYRYVDLVDRTEVHAHCRYPPLAQSFDSFLVKVAERFPETRTAFRAELEDPSLARKLPKLLKMLESTATMTEPSSSPTTVIKVGSIAHSFNTSNTSIQTVSANVPDVEKLDDIIPEPAVLSEQTNIAEADEVQADGSTGELTETETQPQESPSKQIADVTDRIIVTLLLRGCPDFTIAQRIGLSRKTVSNRVSRLRKRYPDLVPTRDQLKKDPSLGETLLEKLGLSSVSGNSRELEGKERELAGKNRESI